MHLIEETCLPTLTMLRFLGDVRTGLGYSSLKESVQNPAFLLPDQIVKEKKKTYKEVHIGWLETLQVEQRKTATFAYQK